MLFVSLLVAREGRERSLAVCHAELIVVRVQKRKLGEVRVDYMLCQEGALEPLNYAPP
jgi:hypothetical protein